MDARSSVTGGIPSRVRLSSDYLLLVMAMFEARYAVCPVVRAGGGLIGVSDCAVRSEPGVIDRQG